MREKQKKFDFEPADTYSPTHFPFLDKQTATRYSHLSFTNLIEVATARIFLLSNMDGPLLHWMCAMMAFDSPIVFAFLENIFILVLLRTSSVRCENSSLRSCHHSSYKRSHMKVQTLKIQFPTNTSQIHKRYLLCAEKNEKIGRRATPEICKRSWFQGQGTRTGWIWLFVLEKLLIKRLNIFWLGGVKHKSLPVLRAKAKLPACSWNFRYNNGHCSVDLDINNVGKRTAI